VDGQSPITCQALGGVWLGAGTTCDDANVNCFPDPDDSTEIPSTDTCFGPWCSTWEGEESDSGSIHPTWPPWWGTSSSTSTTSVYVPPTFTPTMGPTDDGKKDTTSGPTHEYEECCESSGCFIDFTAPTPEEVLEGSHCGDENDPDCPCDECLKCKCAFNCVVYPGDSYLSCPDCGLPDETPPKDEQLPRWPDPESPWVPSPEQDNGWRVEIPAGCCCSLDPNLAQEGVVNNACVTVEWEVKCLVPSPDCTCQGICNDGLNCSLLAKGVHGKTTRKCKECCSQPEDEPSDDPG
jgi:hypothetical protein